MRPLARPYLQHGDRHLPTGSDPIHGLHDSPLEIMIAYGQLSASGASATYIDLATWVSSNEDVFTLEVGGGGLSSTHGIAIHEEGIYRLWSTWFVDSGTNGDILEGELDAYAVFGSFWGFGNNQFRPTTIVYDNSTPADLIQVANIFYIGGPAGPDPVVLPARIFANFLSYGGNDYHVEFETVIERLATSYTSNTVSHTPV